ncbi:MAG: hypothetical protein ACD_73C00395G0001 [uncultured bacterium]|nr:MAG: hypothetical protein ACD_73C00395G0001 [uncultured bacterium]
MIFHNHKYFIRRFHEIGLTDLSLVGGKNASLGEMFQTLVPQGLKIPGGFVVTVAAYRSFLEKGGLIDPIKTLLSGLDVQNLADLSERGKKIRDIVRRTPFPPELEEGILQGYHQLCLQYGENTDVAVRSSATAEDLPTASFAGQQETFLNVQGVSDLLEACKKCFASLFTDRAISYRTEKGFDHMQVGLSIGVQKMVRSDLASSGVVFTIDTETGFRNVVYITSSFGLGETIVRGIVNPDEAYVFKPTLKEGLCPIIEKKRGSKEIKMVYETKRGTQGTRMIPTALSERERFSISDDEILTLARWAILIENHYQKPMDIEWAKDGITGELFILQARPETVHAVKDVSVLETYRLTSKGEILVKGQAVGSHIGSGPARLIRDPRQMADFQDGEVLIALMTDPDWEPLMKKAAAIVTEKGGRTCHAAIVSRELNVPAVVGTSHAMEKIKDGQLVTISCAEGETGYVYEGKLPFVIDRVQLAKLQRPRTKIMMNVAHPDRAFELSFIPNDGVGLARMEFIISHLIQVHPMALIRYPHLKDEGARKKIEELTRGYENKPQYFVDKLAQGIAKIAAAFYPKDVILRFSDFKTNEYAGLIGGKEFEPEEENPMLGFRGASRYYASRYREGFALECQAVKKVRIEMGLANIKVMIPFCRTVEEGKKVLNELTTNGLVRGVSGLEIYMMCEIPSNVLLAEEFAKYFDGFSIGSNDLTQLILGVDRDSETIAPLFDERNAAVKEMIGTVIHVAKNSHIKIGICGQAPSDYPEFAEWLMNLGIDSISLNPDSVIEVTRRLSEALQQELKQASARWTNEGNPSYAGGDDLTAFE